MLLILMIQRNSRIVLTSSKPFATFQLQSGKKEVYIAKTIQSNIFYQTIAALGGVLLTIGFECLAIMFAHSL